MYKGWEEVAKIVGEPCNFSLLVFLANFRHESRVHWSAFWPSVDMLFVGAALIVENIILAAVQANFVVSAAPPVAFRSKREKRPPKRILTCG